MKKRYLKQLLAFVLCAFAVLNSAAAFAAGSNETAASGITVESANGAERVIPSIVSADEWEVLRLVNSERSARGLSPLTTFSTLQSGAEIRAREIVTLFSHTRPNGESCFTVLDEVGIGNYQSAGENIAAGQNSPAAVMNSWMNSEGHRNNILSASYKHIGVGMKHEPNSVYGKPDASEFDAVPARNIDKLHGHSRAAAVECLGRLLYAAFR